MSKKLENALLMTWVVSLMATFGSLYFSEIRGYEPCTLCWYQRILMYPIVIMTTVSYIQKNAKIALTTAVFSIIGALTSLYHYGLQKLTFLQDSAPACGRVPCTGEYINWFGFITIPFLALIAFILIAIISIYMLKVLKEEK
ncbi:disulfide bond formation protein B [Lysinibacillus sp. 2017]|uniref:disulfide oxidoreductase n=1 Tax=unclassified Lysinibacillus TaxID=2636778 RepID=UPI000D525ECC|nr:MULTISPECIES: disulfide oxidoreductase [unclassified Lysinibacillus]AWE08701.1 disulfide bond formation protein B [Lysinibacillus sp. 2017]TGN35122.1 disulfide bond formation protein B [Lysinibacillus sp. S2017]